MRSKPVVTVLLRRRQDGPTPGDKVIASAVFHDEDLFRDLVFSSYRETLAYLARWQEQHPTLDVVVNVPASIRRQP
jgi:hypothetical protein